MDTRERLIEAARDCLLEQGHRASSVKAIAARAGVNHGLVHHYFGSKEQLWLAVIERESNRIKDSLQQEHGAFLDDFLVPQFFRHPDRMRLAIEFLALAKEIPAISTFLKEMFRLRRAELQQVLRFDDPVAATLLLGAFFGMALQFSLDPTLPVEEAGQKLIRSLGLEGSPRGASRSGT